MIESMCVNDKFHLFLPHLHLQMEEEIKEEEKCCGMTVSTEFREAFREMLSFALLKNPVFLMFAISNFLTSIGFNMPFIFLPDRAKLAGRTRFLLLHLYRIQQYNKITF